ncbi:hypothetical protein CLV98_102265 [Dyadobacter jejuensis]|uniref:N-acetylglutamate synthase n=1 Tax=Dyadobacter jejuensis TaxID=1082580 RepID=A0A316APC9_9BACT|nr:n-acetylglutamate synthase [Dyadobacter jejuensis]PWJ59432.1 hypothetical protein CLV98_102265 [Dyadobacter jejuensis]
MINYHNKRFYPLSNSTNGEVDLDMVFVYQQQGNVVSCQYAGKNIKFGQLMALVLPDGSLDMRYQQINLQGEIRTGICHSTPEVLADGRIRLYESWQWTSGDRSSGRSILEER